MAGALEVDPLWLAALRRRMDQPPARPRVPLLAAQAGDAVIGTVEPEFLVCLPLVTSADGGRVLESLGASGWRVHGDVTASLAKVARALRVAGLAPIWRNEQLAVQDPDGKRVGTVERAVVRVLGIQTRAVHLVGLDPDGQVWAQLRSFTKANDPGLWDTLMGGMVAACETVETALQRETWEEAGLVLDRLEDLSLGGRVTVRRPSPDGGGAGYVNENIDWYRCTVPHGMLPANQDGEVDRFERIGRAGVLAALQRDEFTIEAAQILCDAL